MTFQRLIRRTALLVGGAAMLAACGQATTGSLSSTGLSSATGASGGGDTHTGTATAPTRGAMANTLSECKAANLTLQLGRGAGAGAGSRYPALQFTNVSDTTCILSGFPGVSYVDSNGGQVGAAAARAGSQGAPVTLAPGQVASALVQEANTEDFPPSDCNPVPVQGFRVYAPDDTAALFVPFSSAETACSSTSMPGGQQLSVHSVAAGSGDE